jgi:hypothetical protein
VEGDSEGKLMKRAIAEHRGNLNIYSATKDAPFIDDPLAATGKTLLGISIPGAARALHKSHIPMLILVSWYDAGTVQGTIQRFRRTTTTAESVAVFRPLFEGCSERNRGSAIHLLHDWEERVDVYGCLATEGPAKGRLPTQR